MTVTQSTISTNPSLSHKPDIELLVEEEDHPKQEVRIYPNMRLIQVVQLTKNGSVERFVDIAPHAIIIGDIAFYHASARKSARVAFDQAQQHIQDMYNTTTPDDIESLRLGYAIRLFDACEDIWKR